MATIAFKNTRSSGRDALAGQYLTVGAALSHLEMQNAFARSPSETLVKDFQHDVAFVPTEVLESYLEDLLNLQVEDGTLHIKSPARFTMGTMVPFLGLLLSLGLGVYLAAHDLSFVFACLATILASLPFIALLRFMPSSRTTRRMLFARVVSREVTRRRGRSDDDPEGEGFRIVPFLFGKRSGYFQGAARSLNPEMLRAA
jgi:hypothetical protein